MATSFGDIEGTLGLDVTAIDALDQYDKKLTESIQVMGQAEQAVKQMDAALAQAPQSFDLFTQGASKSELGIRNMFSSMKQGENAFAGLMDKNGELIPKLEQSQGMFASLGRGVESVGGVVQSFGGLVVEFIQNPLKASGDIITGFMASMGPMGLGLMAIGGAAGLVGKQIWDLGSKAAQVGDRMGDMADTMAISTEATSALDYAMKVAGGSLERGSNLIFQIQTRMENSPTQFGEALRSIGLNFETFQAMQPDQKLYALSRAFQENTDHTNRATVAMDLLGRTGRDAIPLLMKDLAGLAEESRQLGYVWSKEDTDAAQEFNMATKRLGAAVDELTLDIGKELMPVLNDAVVLLTFLSKHSDVAGVSLAKLVSGSTPKAFEAIAAAIHQAASMVKDFSTTVEASTPTIDKSNKTVGVAEDVWLQWYNEMRTADAQMKIYDETQKKATESTKKLAEAKEKEAEATRKANVELFLAQNGYKNIGEAMVQIDYNVLELVQKMEVADETLGNFGKWTLPPEFNLSTITAAMSVEQLQRAGLHTAAALRILGEQAGRLPKPVEDASEAIDDATKKTLTFGEASAQVFGAVANVLGNASGQWYEFAAIVARTGQQAIQAFSSGDMLGGTIALVTGGIAALGKALEDQEKKINPVREAYVQAAGGLQDLNEAAYAATGSLHLMQKLLAADTEEEYAKAIEELNQALEWNNQLEANRAKLADARLALGEKQIDNLNAVLGPLEEQTARWNELEDQIAAAKKEGKEFDELLAQQAGTLQYSATQLEDLGLIAVATFGSALAAGMSFSQAVEAAGPALGTLQQAFEALGVSTDNEYLKILMVQGAILDNNPALVKAIGALGDSFAALDALGNLNVDTFRAMERTGTDMYARLQAEVAATGGSTRDALLPMQDFLHDAEEAAKKLGIPLDENTQLLIDQSKELGIWKDQGKSATDILIDQMNELVESIGKLIDSLNSIPDVDYRVTEFRDFAQGHGIEVPEPGDARATGQAMGGTGRADGPTWFYTAGNEDWAFSGEGKTFEDRMQADSRGSGPDLSFLPQMIKDGIRDGFQEARGAA